jgi:hypothetical protein
MKGRMSVGDAKHLAHFQDKITPFYCHFFSSCSVRAIEPIHGPEQTDLWTELGLRFITQ